MKRTTYIVLIFTFLSCAGFAQEIVFDKQASVNQCYLKSQESKNPLPMNDLDVETGYVLYEAEIDGSVDSPQLNLENVRDYAVVFLDDQFQGTLTDQHKQHSLKAATGRHKLRIFVENIGRITYGPEILDNSKGLFGSITLGNEEIENWVITPLGIRNLDVSKLVFEQRKESALPGFFQAEFMISQPDAYYLDISGWGMGEVWINGTYAGAYWEEEKQQSIQLPVEFLKAGKNEITVFELKNLEQKNMKLSKQAVFR
jgi:beta-galactosidase